MTDGADAMRREIEWDARVNMLRRLALKLRADANWFAARGVSISARSCLTDAQQYEADANFLAATFQEPSHDE